jgi:site-specific DNA recombinase
MAGKRAIIWTAVSSEEQAAGDKDSLAHQERLGRAAAAKHNLDVVDVLRSDDSRSIIRLDVAMKNPKLGYAQLVEAIERKQVDVLFYYSIDRLGRNMALVTTVMELCRAAGVVLYDLSNPPATLRTETGDMERIGSTLQAVMAQSEVDKFKSRARFGRTARARRGEFLATIPYGYTRTGEGTIATDPTAAAVVLRIFDEYLQGHGSRRIAEGLNADGIPTPHGSTWMVGTVVMILRNVLRYAGWMEHNRYSRKWRDPYMRVRGNWPALIDDATAERIQSERRERNANRRLADTPHLLSGVVYCIDCDAPMRLSTVDSGRNKSGVRNRLTYLRCTAAKHPFWQVRADALMGYIAAKITELRTVDIDALCAADAGVDRAAAALDTARRELARLQRALEAVDDDYYVGGKLDADRYARQVQRITVEIANRRAEIERLDAQLQREAERGSRRDRLLDVRDNGAAMLRSADPTAANVWLREHVRVWIRSKELREDEVIVEWI